MKDLYEELVQVLMPEEIDHYESDLYVKVNEKSTKVIDKYFNENEQLSKNILVETFISNIPPHDKWYSIAFAYYPFWKGI